MNLRTPEGRIKFYSTKRWKQARDFILSKSPLCVKCLEDNILTPATDVDHIKDLRDRPDLCLDESNLQSLCKSCHGKKTYAAVRPKQTVYKTVNMKWKDILP
jgi:5-methylcytosine-specific restriction protein A